MPTGWSPPLPASGPVARLTPRPAGGALAHRRAPALAVAAMILTPVMTAGQVQTGTGTVTGTVTGVDAQLVAEAHVTVKGTRLGALTGGDGRFFIEGVPEGMALLEIRRMGYLIAAHPVEVIPDVIFTLDVELELDPVRLDQLEGYARRLLSPELTGFFERRGRGGGHYFTRDEIGRMNARLLTDVLRRVPGVRVEPLGGPMGTSQVVRMQRATGISGARSCPVQYFLNGVHFGVAPEIGINSYVRPDEVAAMEVYSGTSRLPPQFHTSQRNSRCGVIVIWTHAGDRRQPR